MSESLWSTRRERLFCRIFGHRWFSFAEDIRVCRRCYAYVWA